MKSTTSGHKQSAPLITRRRLLQAGGVGALSLGMPGMVAAQVNGGRKLGGGAAEKSCIFILLCGGPSHLDTWDLKPEAPAEIRGPYQPIATAVPGMQISELNPRLAKMSQHFSLIRSMTHVGNISNHFDAMHHLLSGQADAPLDSPYMGAILAKVRPSQRTVAPYVWLIKCVGDPVFCAPNIGTGGYLGMTNSPLFVGSANNHPAMPEFTPPEELLPAVPLERMHKRRTLLDGLNPAETATGSAGQKDWQDLYGRAFELASGTEGRLPYELDREPTAVRERYGMHPLGQNLLLARRLVEAGVGFVTVNGWTGTSPTGGGGAPSSSWDMHGGEMGMGSAFGDGSYGMGWCMPKLDEALSALLTDLQERGLLDNTMVVVAGEFGRTPRINAPGANPGRQHWPACYSAILAGGGIRGGMVYGASDKTASYVKDLPVRSQDLGATIYHALGVPLELRLGQDGFTRPISSGQPIMRLFG
ncbi:MAG: DUF1501 domain-containing protein [Pirellulales bacterium]